MSSQRKNTIENNINMELFLHGTSLKNAKGITSPTPAQRVIYCFKKSWPEGMAGALAFATANGKRSEGVEEEDFLRDYTTKNPKFPRGILGAALRKMLVNIAKKNWEIKHRFNKLEERIPVVMLFTGLSFEVVQRKFGIREVKLKGGEAVKILVPKDFIYHPIGRELTKRGVVVEEIEEEIEKLKKEKGESRLKQISDIENVVFENFRTVKKLKNLGNQEFSI